MARRYSIASELMYLIFRTHDSSYKDVPSETIVVEIHVYCIPFMQLH